MRQAPARQLQVTQSANVKDISAGQRACSRNREGLQAGARRAQARQLVVVQAAVVDLWTSMRGSRSRISNEYVQSVRHMPLAGYSQAQARWQSRPKTKCWNTG